jgi:hypothetical protein
MTIPDTPGSSEGSPDGDRQTDPPAPATVFELLANERRIRTLSYLFGNPGPVDVDTLGAAVAAAERRGERRANEGPPAAVHGGRTRTGTADGPGGARGIDERVSLELRHVHLPKLETAGVIAYRSGDGTVELRMPTALLAPYLELAVEQ